jgi:hypothetical protein
MKRVLFSTLLLGSAGAAPPGTALGYALDGFTLSLPAEAKICIEQPAERRDARACAGVKMPTAGTAEGDAVAHLSVRDLQITLVIHGGKMDPDPHGPMTRKYIDENLGRGLENAQAQGVRVHGFHVDDLYDLVTVGGVPAMRNVMEIANKRLITYAVQGRTSLTSVGFYSDAAHLEAAKQLAEQIMATVHVLPPKGASRSRSIRH